MGAALNYQVTGSWPQRPVALPTRSGKLSYRKLTLSTDFLAESCTIGDFNDDGAPDVSSGRRWYEGPSFQQAHVFRGGHEALPRMGTNASEITTGDSDDIADYAYDMNGDGWADIINIANPDAVDASIPNPAPAPQAHATAYWYENPAGQAGAVDAPWSPHLMHADVRAEQHGLVDVDGDGKPEIFGACKACEPASRMGYYQADWSEPGVVWSYHAVTRAVVFPYGIGKLHGLGFGDINGDGKPDLLERSGIWLQAQAPAPNEVACPATNCGWVNTTLYDGDPGDARGPSQMYAYDVDGDGDSDVVAADWAHGYGMAWYEQTAPLAFTRRQFLGRPGETKFGPVFSELHALEVADMDGDGVPDLVTGKMHFASPIAYNDPDPLGDPVLYVFKTVRNAPSSANDGSVSFVPYAIDTSNAKVGVGKQIALGHLNTDGVMDLCVATKLGLYVFLGE